ncbi:GPP34 family phosphoprotein [Actinocrinis puniceicyclus]|uniref:GPP34 family phosphoprotein n=1 Tax=Actinocrinis puniceicyclus TaxID=977794 RepID=A0A8J7WP74_9ACTN|nr:GPP34 family phosphoprotein [Actinocrinis puniceicyclus]MBS2963030.1 GPP34 family phosphoprotein [Actinocrinis puniceicyclus]
MEAVTMRPAQAPGRPGRLADDFFLMAHDETSGKPRLPERIAGLGLAAALLGELALSGRVEPRDGTVAVLDAAACGDELAGRMLEFLKQEQHPTRTWLAFFGGSAHEEVGLRMVGDGLLVRASRRRPWQAGRWVPAAAGVAARPTALLCTALIRGQRLDERSLLLLGLLRATGLDQPVLWEVRQSEPHALRRIDGALALLRPPLAELTGQTEAAVGNAIATRRF